MSRVTELVENFFGVEHGQLIVQDNSVMALAEKFGTPCFVYDASVLEKKLACLRAALGDDYSVFYSMKANPDPNIVRFFQDRVEGIEIASLGEFKNATDCGCPPARIIFAGPGKTDHELDQVIAQDIGEIHAESRNELLRIHTLARRLNRVPNVCLRINPGEQSQGGAMRMGGVAAPFGIDEESLPEIIDFCQNLSHLTISGIHLFAGTQLLDAQTLITQYRQFLDLADSVATQLRSPLKSIDFGGGLGIPYFENETHLDLDEIAADLKSLPVKIKSNPRLQHARLMLEPGRFLTAEAGIYVSKVLDVKSSRGTNFVILDGGMHHHLAASGNLGQVIKRNFPIACLNKMDRANSETYEVVGPLCTPLDRVGRKVSLPKIEPGDLIGIFCSGAYGRSASPTGFLSHPAPKEIFIEGKSITVHRVRLGDDDG